MSGGTGSLGALLVRRDLIVEVLPTPRGPAIYRLNPLVFIFKATSMAFMALSCPMVTSRGETSLVVVKVNSSVKHLQVTFVESNLTIKPPCLIIM